MCAGFYIKHTVLVVQCLIRALKFKLLSGLFVVSSLIFLRISQNIRYQVICFINYLICIKVWTPIKHEPRHKNADIKFTKAHFKCVFKIFAMLFVPIHCKFRLYLLITKVMWKENDTTSQGLSLFFFLRTKTVADANAM